jgi:hypothetical protein
MESFLEGLSDIDLGLGQGSWDLGIGYSTAWQDSVMFTNASPRNSTSVAEPLGSGSILADHTNTTILSTYTETLPLLAQQPAGAISPIQFDPLDDIWQTLFGPPIHPTLTLPSHAVPPNSSNSSQIQRLPQPGLDTSYLTYPAPQTTESQPYNLRYLHHYLNVVLPLQYRFVGISVGDYITPLALSHATVHTSISSLAALHLAVQRRRAPLSHPCSPLPFTVTQLEDDAFMATKSHQESISRLRYLSSGDLTAEQIVVSALFAISYHLFSGGMLIQWREALGTAQRCLKAAVDASPELNGRELHFISTSRYAFCMDLDSNYRADCE